MSVTTPTLVSIRQAMTLAGVSRRTIYNWIALDKIAYVRTAGGSIRIVATSLFRPGSGVITNPDTAPL